ncbi:MAG: hypothetical protein ACYC67_05520 [Prosthecobacter sp.]
MLQIITGKFFETENRHTFDGKGILYSNFNSFLPIETCVGRLEPVDARSSPVGYVYTYVNQIEQSKNNQFGIIRAGDGEIIEQFRLLCSFGLRATFAEDRSRVSHLCRTGTVGQSDSFAPTQMLAGYFKTQINGEQADSQLFIEMVAKVISLGRNDFRSIMSALRAFNGALEVVGSSLDLAYSMLVYALESLAQKYISYSPNWSDYDVRTKSELESIFAALPAEQSDRIKNALLSNAHLKLRARFLDFISSHVEDTYFTSSDPNKSPLQKYELRRASQNIYNARSGYVHELTPLLDQIRNPQIAEADVFRWELEPHLTFGGLVRLSDHVIRNLIKRLPSVEKEKFQWRSELPGIIRLHVAPQYWIHLAKSFAPAVACKRLEGFLSHYVEVMAQGGAICDMSEVMAKVEQMVDGAKLEHQRAMLALYALYNMCLIPVLSRPGWEAFLEKHQNIVDEASIEMMAVRIVLDYQFLWSYEEGDAALSDHERTRFHKNAFHLPHTIDVALTIAVANQALTEKRPEACISTLKKALVNSSGHPALQSTILKAIDEPSLIDISHCLPKRFTPMDDVGL